MTRSRDNGGGNARRVIQGVKRQIAETDFREPVIAHPKGDFCGMSVEKSEFMLGVHHEQIGLHWAT